MIVQVLNSFWKTLILVCVSVSLLGQQTHTVINLLDSGPGSLRATINASAHGDIVTFSPNLLANGSATINLNSEISFARSLTIKGLFLNGDTLAISGNNTASIFHIDGSSFALPVRVYLEDLVLENAKKNSTSTALTANGGAIFGSSLEYFGLNNVIMRGNQALGSSNGGAMFLNQVDTVILKRCTFYRNNTDTSGSANSTGGVTRMRFCNVFIDSCEFRQNASDFLGGALSILVGSLYISNSLWANNKVGMHNRQVPSAQRGGAISAYAQDSVYIINSKFLNNITRSSGSFGGEGGAVYTDRSNTFIKECMFSQNKAIKGEGGAVRSYTYFSDTTDKLVIVGCSFIDNEAERGGALETVNKNAVLSECFFKANSALEGGAIYGYLGSLLLKNSTLLHNVAATHASACYLDADMTSVIDNCSILDTVSTGSLYFELPNSWEQATTGRVESSIIVNNGLDIINATANITSEGFNIFSGNPSFSIASDTNGLQLANLNLLPLGDYGGVTQSMPPAMGSPAFNTGDPNDFEPAQNGPIFGRRDCGAAEASVTMSDTVEFCGTYSWWGNTFNKPGLFSDTAFNTNSIDSVGLLFLQEPDSLVKIINGKLNAPSRATNVSYQWIVCDSLVTEIFGATDSLFKPNVNGNYAVVITSQNCTDTSECISYNQVGILEKSSPTDFVRFYPNPSHGKIRVLVADRIQLESLRVYDPQGRLISKPKIGDAEISLKNLPSGIFFLQWLSTTGNIQIDQVVIE